MSYTKLGALPPKSEWPIGILPYLSPKFRMDNAGDPFTPTLWNRGPLPPTEWPRKEKCSHWKLFETNHPQILRFLSRRGPRSTDMGLSQHYIGPKWHSNIFQISAEKRFRDVVSPLHSFNKYRKFLLSSLEPFFLQKFGKRQNVIFVPMWCWDSCPGF